jgi:hypothetical protein
MTILTIRMTYRDECGRWMPALGLPRNCTRRS